MKKKIISLFLSTTMLVGMCNAINFTPIATAAHSYVRKMEYLDRGTVAVKVTSGVYLTWRLLGTEDQSLKFDVYRDGVCIATAIDSTNYTDPQGTLSSKYQVVSTGSFAKYEKTTSVWEENYYDLPISKPADAVHDKSGVSYSYSANDASVGDVDGDGEYEIILKWDPNNSKDNANEGYTGNVYIDAYRLNGTRLWRIDLGKNIRAGAHYTQFMVYDFDGDGKAEVAMKTAPGSIDGRGNYVTAAGNTATIKNADNTKDYRNSAGRILEGPEYLTIFNGYSGEAMQTIDYNPPRGDVNEWGKKGDGGNRVDRFLACVAYLNGTTPSLVMCRGYYGRSVLVAYDWNGENLTQKWIVDSGTSSSNKLYGQGNHSLSVADLDLDGKDEIVYGSAVIDDDGKLYHSTGHGHGDAMHVNDFNNDGKQEIFQVHEADADYGVEVRSSAKSYKILSSYGFGKNDEGKIVDVGRGIMVNTDDSYASKNPNALSSYWCSASDNIWDLNGNVIDGIKRPVHSAIFILQLFIILGRHFRT